ncbi:hypothetical protein KFK09_003174 [Dendrobium nobile]|uniref:Uncharacterized protein n=1 Tax=Dendrobium nobile TaxID=94219 RepID=A0A8T3C8C2_DENNO|nr:hypothetical protein KFK09_003174 [Dendrobium nobile]
MREGWVLGWRLDGGGGAWDWRLGGGGGPWTSGLEGKGWPATGRKGKGWPAAGRKGKKMSHKPEHFLLLDLEMELKQLFDSFNDIKEEMRFLRESDFTINFINHCSRPKHEDTNQSETQILGCLEIECLEMQILRDEDVRCQHGLEWCGK